MGSGFLIFPEDWIDFGESILDFFLDPFIGAVKKVFHLLWNDTLGGFQAIIDYVDQELQRALDYLPNPLDIVSYVEGVVYRFVTDTLPGLVTDVVNGAVDLAVSGIRDLIAGIEDAYNFAIDLVNQAYGLAQDALSQVEDFIGSVEGLLEAGFNKAIDFVRHLIDGAIDALTNFVNDAIEVLRNDILPAIENFIDDLFPFLGDLAQLWSDIFGWLVWIARLPFEGIHAFEHLVYDRLTYANVKGGVGHFGGWAGDIETTIAHVLG